MPFRRALPLYQGLGFYNRDEALTFDNPQGTPCAPARDSHPGLIFDKYIDTWSIQEDGACKVQPPDPKNRHPGSKRRFYDEQVGRDFGHLFAGLAAVLVRQKQLLDTLGGDDFELATDWRFVTGLGSGHPFETGMIWHRMLGVPYLPGSSIKGLLRAWVRPESEGGWGEAQNREMCKSLFGDTTTAGRLIIFDALPVKVPQLDVDIMNPHYGAYYSDPTGTPPADYLSPKPVFFLAVKAGQQFRFSLATRPGAYKTSEINSGMPRKDLEDGLRLLKEALITIGAGGKTAVGYGVFREVGSSRPESLSATETVWDKATLKWTKGNQTLTASCGSERAQLKLSNGADRDRVLGDLAEDARRRLLDKCELRGVEVTLERTGNAYRIISCAKS